MYLVHDYRYGLPHREKYPCVVECVDRGCGNPKESKRSYECNAITADLKIAQHFWGMMLTHILKVSACNLMVRTISAIMKIASPPTLLHEPSPTLASASNLSILKKLK